LTTAPITVTPSSCNCSTATNRFARLTVDASTTNTRRRTMPSTVDVSAVRWTLPFDTGPIGGASTRTVARGDRSHTASRAAGRATARI
jgi:hypothetical protein